MWNDKPDGYPIPARNPMGTGTGTDFYPRVWVWVWVRIFTRNPFTGGRVIALPDPNPTRCHPYHFTMIGQSLGSVYLAWEALTKFTPQFYIDTSGYAFTYPLAWLFGCKVICYTHYPTINSDMVERVKQHNSMYNNNSHIGGRYALSK
jgi:hypothetical protein